MTLDALLTLLVIAGAVTLFVSERLPADVVALLVLASVLVLGLVTPAEALSGFSSEATITVAAMFVLSAGLQATGALRALGRLIARVHQPLLLTFLVMALVGGLSAFVNNTAAVAVLLPLVLTATNASKLPSSQLLIPLSYAAQMGGVCTLIGTSTNLLVNSLAKDLGHPGFGLFAFTRLGLVMMAAGFVYILIVQRWLLPKHRPADLTETYELGKYITELRVLPGSPLIGRSVAEARLGEKYGVFVLELLRGEEKVWEPRAERLQAGDVMIARGDWSQIALMTDKTQLEINPEFRIASDQFEDKNQVMAEIMIAPGSRLIGQTLGSSEFHRHYNATVLALHRRGEILREKLREVRFSVGDVLLLLAPGSEMAALRRSGNLVVLTERDQAEPGIRRALLAVAIMAVAVAVAALGWLPIVTSAILGCIALVATRCLRNDEAYEAIDWRVIMLLAGVIPLGIAMQKSGLAQFMADHLLAVVGAYGPLAVLAAVYLLTAVLTEMMSNNATAVLITPIAFSTAQAMDVSPTPFLIAVLFAASTSFATPIGYQTNTMVYNAGGYRFTDFIKIGVPLNLLFWGLAVYFIPRYFPF